MRASGTSDGETLLRLGGELQVFEVLPVESVGFAHAPTMGETDTVGIRRDGGRG